MLVGAIVVVSLFEISGVIISGVFVSGNNVVDDTVLSAGDVVVSNILADAIYVCPLYFRFNIFLSCVLLIYNGCRILVV